MRNLNNPKNKKRIVLVIILTGLIFLGFVTTYAFINTLGNTKNENIRAEAGTLSLVFEDGNPSIKGELEFGSSIVKTFTIENTGTLDATAIMYFENLINTYTPGSLTYTLSYSETEDGEYSEVVTKTNVPKSETNTSRTLSNSLTIPAKQKYYYKLTITLNYLEDIDQTNDFSAIFSSNFKLLETGNKALDTVYALGLKTKEGTLDFGQAATTDETSDGLYSMEDDYGMSYYFRGAVENNYVKFAGFYWRIIRINGDGSLRLSYDGAIPYRNGESSTDRTPIYSYFNSNAHDAKYLGYMYGGMEGVASTSKQEAQTNETDSNAKKLLDEWYKTNIADKGLSNYISDTLFCNDRSTASEANSWANGDTTLGYGTNITFYGNYNRMVNFDNTVKESPTATLKCLQKNDRFTVNDTSVGNGDLTYPVGMITGDEVLLGGSGRPNNLLNSGGVQANTSYYLYKGHQYWTMTPGSQYSDSFTDLVKVWENGVLKANGWSVVESYGISPVINIAPKYAEKMTGSGYINDPYIVE